jgi:hypothetical protein
MVMRRLLSDISFNLPSERHTETAGQESVELRTEARARGAGQEAE